MPDLRLLRSDPFAFADTVGLRLAAWKAPALSYETLFTPVVGPRQTGKSDLLVLAASHWAFARPGSRVLLCSAGGERAQELMGRIRGVVLGSEILRDSVIDESRMVVTLDNASEVRAIPTSEAAARGWSVDLLCLDEAQQLDESMWAALLPTVLARPGARVLLCGTASRSTGPFFELAKRGEEGRSENARTHYWTLDQCREWVSWGMEQALREGMSERRARSELDNLWESGADCLLSASVLARMKVDYVADRLGGRGPGRVLAGFDLGVTDDHSVLCCLGRMPVVNAEGLPVFAVRSIDAWPSGAPWSRVVADVKGSEAAFDGVFADATSFGRGFNESMLFPALRERLSSRGGGHVRPGLVLAGEYAGGDPFASDEEVAAARRRARYARQALADGAFRTATRNVVFSSASKSCMYGALVMLAQRDQLLVPASATTLIRELTMIEVETLPSGGERIAAPGRGKDDHCDAMALSLAPIERDGKWSSWVAGMAHRRSPFAAPEPREGWVQGPGFMVPRRPAWTSPNGRGVSEPDDSGGDGFEGGLGFRGLPADWSMARAG